MLASYVTMYNIKEFNGQQTSSVSLSGRTDISGSPCTVTLHIVNQFFCKTKILMVILGELTIVLQYQ